jgi:hypothetical protein
VPRHRVEAIAHLVRQGLAIEGQFGVHPLEALIWVARTVEESIYQPRSFVRTPTGIAFTLANPPLRSGAFSSLRIGVNGQPPSAEHIRVRSGATGPWRVASTFSRADPLELRPGEPTEYEVDVALVGVPHRFTVRLEFQSVAIPPLVWIEFTDRPHSGPGGG